MAASPESTSRRTWQDVAYELSGETDPNKVTKLAEELDRVMQEEQDANNGHFKWG